MKILCCENGPFLVNTYCVINETTGDCFIIDPGSDEISELVDVIDQHGYNLESVVCTHGHIDHIAGVPYIKERFKAPLFIHKSDEEYVLNSSFQARMFGVHDPGKLVIDHYIPDDGIIMLAGMDFTIFHTPGHSQGSISLYGSNVVFAGDTLFNMSIGRTDLPGGSYVELIESISRKIFILPDDTRVLSGHGPETIVGIEKEMNPFFT